MDVSSEMILNVLPLFLANVLGVGTAVIGLIEGVAESIPSTHRGLAFGLHRAADTGGAVLGLLITIVVVAYMQGGTTELSRDTFRTLVWLSLVPALLAVLTIVLGVRETRRKPALDAPRVGFRGLGRRFAVFLAIVALFDLGNFSDAFLVLRAQERGLGVDGVLWTLLGFSLVYALVSTPAGALSDRIGRRRIIIAGWVAYAAIYLGFARADSGVAVRGFRSRYEVRTRLKALCSGGLSGYPLPTLPRRLHGSDRHHNTAQQSTA
jgi:MFS family permease